MITLSLTTRKSFHSELEDLAAQILKMGLLVEEAIRDGVESLKNKDQDLARKVIEGDDAIDDLETEIEQTCLRLFALQQPMAVDLRMIGTALKIITDLERMADHAVDIAKVTIRLGNEPLIKPLIDIPRMAEITQRMVRECLDAFIRKDAALAHKMAAWDEEVDHLYAQVFRELLVFMIEDPKTIRQATQLLFVGQHLERIADHATNVGEWVVYMVTGEKRDLNK